MARAKNFSGHSWEISEVRTITIGPIAADSATLSDANYPELADDTNGGSFNCHGLETVWLGVEIDGGTNPEATIDLLIRDDTAPGSTKWVQFNSGSTTGSIQSGKMVEVTCAGRWVYPRVSAVANATSTTGMRILAFPGKVRRR
ncbi:MAG: hypothetical protein ACTHU0_21975 [Kofleriaceae bacterium]